MSPIDEIEADLLRTSPAALAALLAVGQCGCTGMAWNSPCGCHAGATSLCPSWSPVDGCRCPGGHATTEEAK